MLARDRVRPQRRLPCIALLLAAALAGGCGRAEPRAEGRAEAAASTPVESTGTASGDDRRAADADGGAPSPASAADAAPADAPAPVVVYLGDSLTAGYGLDEDEAFPALVARVLADEGTPIRTVNAGVSGDTTAGGLARLDWLLRQDPDVLVVGLGGNDGLRGLAPEASAANLGAIVTRAQAADAVVVLLGMRMPPNYGPDYTERFAAIYPTIAAEHPEVILVPFMLAGVGGEPHLNLPDGIHPNAEGQRIVAQTVLSAVREALGRR